MCDYGHQVHYTPKARVYQQQKCVASWMEKMTNESECVRYMSGIADGSLSGCTVADLETLCKSKAADFSVADAHRLCAYQNAAMELFWREKQMF